MTDKGIFLPAMASHSSASMVTISLLICRLNVSPTISFLTGCDVEAGTTCFAIV